MKLSGHAKTRLRLRYNINSIIINKYTIICNLKNDSVLCHEIHNNLYFIIRGNKIRTFINKDHAERLKNNVFGDLTKR